MIYIENGRFAKVNGFSVQIGYVSPKGRSYRPLMPLISHKPHDIALEWVMQNKKPEITGYV